MRDTQLEDVGDGNYQQKERLMETCLALLPDGAELTIGPRGEVIGFSVEVVFSFADENIGAALDKIVRDFKKTLFNGVADEGCAQTTRRQNLAGQDGQGSRQRPQRLRLMGD